MSKATIVGKTFYKPFEFVVNIGSLLTARNFKLNVKTQYDFFNTAITANDILDNGNSLNISTSIGHDILFKKNGSNYVLEFDDMVYSTIRRLYDVFERKIYYHENGLFDTKIINEKVCININDIKTFLGYSHSYNFVRYHQSRGNFQTVDGIYADVPNIKKLLFGNHIRKPRVTELINYFSDELSPSTQNVSHQPEVNVLSDIIEYLKEEKIQYELQFCCLKYKIDMYLPDYKIAIEVDEIGHSDRNQKYETERENKIKNTLCCRFLRINPHKSNFRITSEIGKLSRMIHF